MVEGFGCRGELYGYGFGGGVGLGREVFVGTGPFSWCSGLGWSERGCIVGRFFGPSFCVLSRVFEDGRVGVVLTASVVSEMTDRGCGRFYVLFPDGGSRGGSGCATPSVCIFTLGRGGWTSDTASVIRSCSGCAVSSGAQSGVVRGCLPGGASRGFSSGLLRIPGSVLGDLGFVDSGRSFPVWKLFQAFNRLDVLLRPTLWRTREVSLGSTSRGRILLDAWVGAVCRPSAASFSSGGVEGSSGGASTGGGAGSGSGSGGSDTAVSGVGHLVCCVSSAATRLGGVWRADPKRNNVWRNLVVQLHCGFSESADFVVSSGGCGWGDLRGDCEDYVLLAVDLVLESGVLSPAAPPDPTFGLVSSPFGPVEWVGLVACAIEKDGVLSTTPNICDVAVERVVIHMCFGVKFTGSSLVFLGDCTSASATWRWTGRVYWVTTVPIDGSRGTTLFFCDTSRETAGDTFCGQDIRAGGTVDSRRVGGTGGTGGAGAVDVQSVEAGRAVFSSAERAEAVLRGTSTEASA